MHTKSLRGRAGPNTLVPIGLLVAALLVSGCFQLGATKLKDMGFDDLDALATEWTVSDPRLSQPLFKERIFEALPVLASDGIPLDNWVFRPKTPEGEKVPAIVHLSPYFGESLPRGGGSLERVLTTNLTARGYAVVAASVRGTGFSGGCFEIGGPRERQDYNELFEAIAKQSWSNGRIGLIGVSYDGTAPQGALIAGSPYLKTIVPIAAISEWYKYNFIRGVQVNPQGYAFNTYYVLGESLTPVIRPDAENVLPDAQTYATHYCPDAIDVQRAQVQTAPTGLTDPYWEARNFTKFLDKVQPNMSALVVHGLQDYNVKTHNLIPWIPELEKHGVSVKVLLGQWGHAYPGTGTGNRADWNLTLLRWFDYWLKDKPTGIMDGPRAEIQDIAGDWRQEDTFPPTRATPRTFYFDASGKLQDAAGAGTSSFVDAGAAENPSGPDTGTSLSFLGPELTQDFRYSGEAYAVLDLDHTAARGHVAVIVYNVTGTSWVPVNWGYYNFNIRNAPDRYDPVVPGERFHLRVPLLPTDMKIAAGSQIGVVVGAQSRAIGFGAAPNMLPPPSGGRTTLHHGAASYISFPSLADAVLMDPQPPLVE